MNKVIDNETGTFSCTATTDGLLLNIKAGIEYLHAFEKAEKWPKILELQNALFQLWNQKILLKKNN